MREVSKCYYFKNGRLDLSVLEETLICELKQENEVKVSDVQEAKVYIDASIASIFEEMGSYFMEEEKDNKNT